MVGSSHMECRMDSGGRIVIPRVLRDELGLKAGSRVDVSRYGAGLQLVPGGRTARLEDRDGRMVAVGSTPVGDDELFALIDAGRR